DATGQSHFLAKPIDYDIDGAVAYGVLGTIEQLGDLGARAERPRIRGEMPQQTRFRGGQVYSLTGLPSEQITSRIKTHSSYAENFGGSVRRRPAAASDTHDPLYCLVQTDDVDWCGNAIRGAGNPVILDLWLLGIAHNQDRNIGSPSYRKDRISADFRCPTEI